MEANVVVELREIRSDQNCIDCDNWEDEDDKKDMYAYFVTIISTTSIYIPISPSDSLSDNINSKTNFGQENSIYSHEGRRDSPVDPDMGVQDVIPEMFQEQRSSNHEQLRQLINRYPQLRTRRDVNDDNSTEDETDYPDNINGTYIRLDHLTAPNWFLVVIDYFCYTFFSLELMLRFIFSPSKWEFVKSFLNLVDFVCVLLFFVEIGLNAMTTSEAYRISVLDALFILRMLRIFRVFRLAQHHKGLRVRT